MNTSIKSLVVPQSLFILDKPNPYLIIAEQLGCDELVSEWVSDFVYGRCTYSDLLGREAELFYHSYNSRYRRYPTPSDLLNLIPSPRLHMDALNELYELGRGGVDLYIVSSGLVSYPGAFLTQSDGIRGLWGNTLLESDDGEFAKFKLNVAGESRSV